MRAEDAPDIEHIDLSTMTVLLADGTVLPIVNMFDCDGEDCDDPEFVVTVVAGRDGFGWLDVAVGEPETVH